MFRGHSARELAPIVSDDKQGDVFYSADPHRNLHYPQLTQAKVGKGSGKKLG